MRLIDRHRLVILLAISTFGACKLDAGTPRVEIETQNVIIQSDFPTLPVNDPVSAPPPYVVGIIEPTFDLNALSRARNLPQTMELQGWVKLFGTEVALYPSRADFGKKYDGYCISGRSAELGKHIPVSLDGKFVQLVGSIFRASDVTPSPVVSYIQNYCGGNVVLFITSLHEYEEPED